MPTPNIQRLAEQGVVFRQCFTTNPTCSASRAAMLTGMCPHNSGMLGLAHRGWGLNDYSQHLIHALRDKAGYHTALCGVQHITRDPKVIGYDEIVMTGGPVAKVAPHAVEWLANAPKQPFFLSVGYSDTHREYAEPGPDEDPRWCRPPDPVPDTPDTRRDMAAYKASARELDRGMGMVFDALDAAGLADNTLVICTTDHGIAFPYMKCNLTVGGCGVMLILRGPGGFEGGKVNDALISQIDIYPTLCDLLDIEPPAWLQGHSMMPLARGEADEINEQVYTEVTYHAAYEPQRSARTKRFNYIRRFGERAGKPILPNCDDSIAKNVWLDHGWRERPVAVEQLYDLVFDPHEAHNVATDPRYADALADMRGRLDRWMQATADPLLQGDVPAPAGSRVNNPDGLSPREPVEDA